MLLKSDLDNVNKLIGKNLRGFRTVSGVTQAELSQLLGVTFQQIQKYETGANSITPEKLYLIAQCLKIRPNDLFDLERGSFFSDPDNSKTVMTKMSKETAEFINQFNRIQSPEVREVVLYLTIKLADSY